MAIKIKTLFYSAGKILYYVFFFNVAIPFDIKMIRVSQNNTWKNFFKNCRKYHMLISEIMVLLFSCISVFLTSF